MRFEINTVRGPWRMVERMIPEQLGCTFLNTDKRCLHGGSSWSLTIDDCIMPPCRHCGVTR